MVGEAGAKPTCGSWCRLGLAKPTCPAGFDYDETSRNCESSCGRGSTTLDETTGKCVLDEAYGASFCGSNATFDEAGGKCRASCTRPCGTGSYYDVERSSCVRYEFVRTGAPGDTAKVVREALVEDAAGFATFPNAVGVAVLASVDAEEVRFADLKQQYPVDAHLISLPGDGATPLTSGHCVDACSALGASCVAVEMNAPEKSWPDFQPELETGWHQLWEPMPSHRVESCTLRSSLSAEAREAPQTHPKESGMILASYRKRSPPPS